jgi:hypothetical protein
MPGLAGCVGLYLFQGLGGIRPDTTFPGFKRAIIRPMVVPDLSSSKCSFTSPFGTFVSNWSLNGNALTLDLTIPPNATAMVHVPSDSIASIREGGQPAGTAEGVALAGTDSQGAVYSVESGVYHFSARFGLHSTAVNKAQALQFPDAALRLSGIRWSAGASSAYRIEVFSIAGRSACTFKGMGPAAGLLPIKQLSCGAYIVKMRQGGRSRTQRITLQTLNAQSGSRE